MENGTPVNNGEEYELECVGIGEKGDGVCKTEGGFVVIVPGAAFGNTYRVRITRVLRKLAFAEIV